MESLELSHESVRWLQRLAREHEMGSVWVSFEDVAPSEFFRALISLGLVEQGDISFRLTDFGWTALGTLVEDVG